MRRFHWAGNQMYIIVNTCSFSQNFSSENFRQCVYGLMFLKFPLPITVQDLTFIFCVITFTVLHHNIIDTFLRKIFTYGVYSSHKVYKKHLRYMFYALKLIGPMKGYNFLKWIHDLLSLLKQVN